MAALVHSSHVLMYAPEDSLSCRLEATRMILSKGVICRPDKMQRHRHQAKHYSSCVMIAGMVSSLRSVRISQPFSVTTIVCSY
ncbi:hypothetical protein D0Q16_21710 [Salmonella enterica]|nr:hypothetical protein [Salmonella enterica]EBL0910455.1 hypothetical protein [Salmonella enterica]